MPAPIDPAQYRREVDFSDAPGGNLSLDDLFPMEPENYSPQTTTEQGTPSQPQAEPQVSPAEEEFLRAGETIYTTREDAINGISHKDSIIRDLRAKLATQTGVDPITGNAIAPTPPVAPNAPVNYTQDAKRYFDDLVNAVNAQDPNKYAAVQQKFLQDAFAPVAPIIADVAKSRAIENVAEEIPDFRAFRSSPAFKETLDLMPSLKEAIQTGETYIDASSRLPELYKIAYYAGQGRRVPELVRAAAHPVAPTQPMRPTQAQSTLNPPTTPAAPPDLRTSEGRKALIADAERRGIAEMKW